MARSSWRRPARAALAAVVGSLLVALSGVAPAAPAAGSAGSPVTPGSASGYAFDARCAPTAPQMDAWRTASPYRGVGIYVGGSMRSCGDAEQPHLDRAWVARESGLGWLLLPIWVGPQASCQPAERFADRIDPDPAAVGGVAYAAAARQGRAEAAAAVARLRELQVAPGSTVWYDLEGGYSLQGDDCRRSALRFLSAWTDALHAQGYRSGVYSGMRDGIHSLDYADLASSGSYTMPDQVWFAWYNGRADVATEEEWVRARSWAGQRIHQYAGDVSETHGGVTLRVDRNLLEVGGGSRAPRALRTCGVRVDYADYRRLARGSRGAPVQALQCLLKQARHYPGRVDGRYDADVVRAVRRWQRAVRLRATGRTDARTWTTLHARGDAPLLKRGDVGHAVRRVQRALNAATAADLRVTGVVDAATERWVVGYQRAVGLAAPGIVDAATWSALQRGRR